MNSNSSGRNRRIEHGSIAHLRNKLSRIVRNSLSSRFIITSTWLVPSSSFPFLARIVHHRSRHLQEGNGVSKRLRILRIEDVGERRGEGRREGIKLGGRRRLKEVSLAFEMPWACVLRHAKAAIMPFYSAPLLRPLLRFSLPFQRVCVPVYPSRSHHVKRVSLRVHTRMRTRTHARTLVLHATKSCHGSLI